MRSSLRAVVFLLSCGLSLVSAWAQVSPCPLRPPAGSPINNPPDLYSQNGSLSLDLALKNGADSNGFMHYCYVYLYQGKQIEAPTLRLNPGDQLVLNLTDSISAPFDRKPMIHVHGTMTAAGVKGSDDPCNPTQMLPSSTNMHFHGLNIPPVCHQDDVINTLLQSGDPPFQYSIQIPSNEPPGLYWYHPHPHGNTTTQVIGGASGALIVEGNNPLVQGLTERVLILREQVKTGPARDPDANTQLTLNFAPAIYPEGASPNTINVQPGKQEYWRFLNSSSKQFASLQLLYGVTPQQLEVLAIDGVQLQSPVYESTIYVPPAGRVEFIIPGLPADQTGTFLTLGYDTGAIGDPNEYRVLAQVLPDGSPRPAQSPAHAVKPPADRMRFAGLATQVPTTTRSLYFSEQSIGTNGGTQFFITVQGQKPRVFHMSDPPAIVTNTGAVEDWTIENHSGEVHAFHIHQIHFLVMAINGVPVPNPDLQDTVIVPNWTGSGPYPSVTLRMDFRDPNIAGTFVYHCHILDHEDGGMMAKIQVNRTN
jgi:FtsP/CotA-like multicopper oxidase with cupredoxin domain